MPVLNTNGSAAMGSSQGGEGAISIDGATPPALAAVTGGMVRWLTPTLLIYSQGGAVQQYNTATTAITSLPGTASRLAAGGGIYATALPPGGGIYASPYVTPIASSGAWTLGETSEAGVTVVNSSYATGTGITVYDATGAVLYSNSELLTDNNPPSRGGVFAYRNAQNVWILRATNGGQIPCLTRASVPRFIPVVQADGNIGVCELGPIGGGNYAVSYRLKDAATGFVLSSGNAFNHDAREITPGVIRVAWSLTNGETPADLVVVDLTLATGAWTQATVQGGVLVPQQMPPLTPVNLGTGAPALKKWVGWFYSSGRYGDFRPKQNCLALALDNYADSDGTIPPTARTQMLNAAIAAGAIFCTGVQQDIDVMKSRWDLVAGLWTDEGLPEDLENQAAQFRANLAANGLPSRPILATLQSDQMLRPTWRRPAGIDAYIVEIFMNPPQATYAAQYAAARAQIDQMTTLAAGVPIYLCPQAFDRNHDPAWVAAGAPIISAIIDACGDALKEDQ